MVTRWQKEAPLVLAGSRSGAAATRRKGQQDNPGAVLDARHQEGRPNKLIDKRLWLDLAPRDEPRMLGAVWPAALVTRARKKQNLSLWR